MIDESLRKTHPSRRLPWLACWPAVCWLALNGCASKAPQAANEPNSYPPWVCGLSHNKDRWQCQREDGEPAPAAASSTEVGMPAPTKGSQAEPTVASATEQAESEPAQSATEPAPDNDIGPVSAGTDKPPDSANEASDAAEQASSESTSQSNAAADWAEEKIKLMARPKNHFAIQAGAFPSPEALHTHVDRYGIDPAYRVRLANDGRLFHVLILQVHDSRSAAEAALANLPQPLNGMDLWIRSVGSLQDAMRSADALANDSPSSPR